MRGSFFHLLGQEYVFFHLPHVYANSQTLCYLESAGTLIISVTHRPSY